MRRLYKYSGQISAISFDRQHGPNADIVLYDIRDEKVAPTRVTAYGGLAAYIDALECTDDEERYIISDYYYDRNLSLVYIMIPSTDGSLPAKIVAGPMFPNKPDWDFKIFGPDNHISTDAPQPMSHEAYCAWLEYKIAMSL